MVQWGEAQMDEAWSGRACGLLAFVCPHEPGRASDCCQPWRVRLAAGMVPKVSCRSLRGFQWAYKDHLNPAWHALLALYLCGSSSVAQNPG
uniref:Uncharacterized protein n=1 Tax=uncultured Desulfobacterium sp. TaxID=201089 RepID=E1YIA6_9BACT|nr:unknown protein [uncultured Desulfobacterium sp.]